MLLILPPLIRKSLDFKNMIELQPFTEIDCDRLIQWVPDVKFMLQWTGVID